MTQEATISIITPFYNTGSVFWETYNSIINQTFTNWKWFIINDGSHDPLSLDILKKLKETDHPKIQIITLTKNVGLPGARNTGIDHAESSFLFFIDSDDLIHKTALEKYYLALSSSKNLHFVNSFVKGFGIQEYLWKGGFHETTRFLIENRNTSCFLAKKSAFENLRFDPTMKDGCEDWDFWLHAASVGLWGYTIPEYLFFYRRTSREKWSTLNDQKLLAKIGEDLRSKYENKIRTHGFPKHVLREYEFGSSSYETQFTASSTELNTKTLLCLFPWLEQGGADQFNLNLLKGLKANSWSITIATTLKSDHSLQNEFDKLTNEIIHLANIGDTYSYTYLLENIINLRKPSHILISNSMAGYYLLPWLRGKFPQISIVDYVHCEDPGWYNGGYPFFSATFTSMLDMTFVTSNHLKNWCINRGADPSKVNTCYINVDSTLIQPNSHRKAQIRDQFNIDTDTTVLLYVARLTTQKQPDVLIKILSELKKTTTSFKCIIIGDGPEKGHMLTMIKKLNLTEYIHFLGSCKNESVLDFMDAADIFLLPSLYEGIALSIYEAMAKGLAIVGADTGGQSELVTQDCGFLIKEKNREKAITAYVEKILWLIKHPSERKQMGVNGYYRIQQHFDLTVMINQINDSILNIENKHTRSSEISSYLVVLNRMLYLEKQVEIISGLLNNKAISLVLKNNHIYERLKGIYRKLRKLATLHIFSF